jgi:hypothetical protein
MTSRYEEEDLGKIRPSSIEERESKVSVDRFVDPEGAAGAAGRRLVEAFPKILKGEDLRRFVEAMQQARAENRQILWLIGAHVLKCGLSLYVNSLIRRKYITALATTGSATVHDLEFALFGRSSEDVASELPRGRFGMSAETASHFAAACEHAGKRGLGLGEGLGEYIDRANARWGRFSVFRESLRSNVPATVHVALGTDITHQHPCFPAALVGELSMRDFRILSAVVGKLFDGGVVVVFGSAVVLPEVFLKTVSISYNLGRSPRAVTAASFDMTPQYRVKENVLTRPFKGAGESFSFQGHHEIMLPLLYTLLAERDGE